MLDILREIITEFEALQFGGPNNLRQKIVQAENYLKSPVMSQDELLELIRFNLTAWTIEEVELNAEGRDEPEDGTNRFQEAQSQLKDLIDEIEFTPLSVPEKAGLKEYLVIATMTTKLQTFVQAESIEAAHEIARNTNGGDFAEIEGSGTWSVDSVSYDSEVQ